MAAFDRSMKIDAAPAVVSSAIQASVSGTERLMTVKADTLLVVLRGEVGYVYLLQPGNDDSTRLRLLVDSPVQIRGAFKDKPTKDGLLALISVSETAISASAQDAAGRHLEMLKQRAETGRMAIPAAPTASMDFGIKKPLPSLEKIDKDRPDPWNPDTLLAYQVFMSTIGSGVALGWNWRRMGRPGWALPTVLFAIFWPAALLVAVFLARDSLSSPAGVAGALLGVIVNFLFLLTTWYAQRRGYKQWAESGDYRVLEDYRYDFVTAGIVAVLIVMGFSVVIGVLVYSQTQPERFESSDMVITYPAIWNEQNELSVPACQTADFECLIVVADGNFGFTGIMVGKYQLESSMSAADVEFYSRESLYPQIYPETLTSDTLEVDGLPAARRYYSLPPQEAGDDDQYAMQIYVVHDLTVYEITVQSRNAPIFEERRRDIDAFIAGIDFAGAGTFA